MVDDGSTDDGAEVVRGFDDPRIRLIQQENGGVSAARNRGIEAARTELVAFLDADDEWLPTFLKVVIRLRKLYPSAGLYGTAYELHYPGSIVKTIYTKSLGDGLLSYFGTIIHFGSGKPNYPFNSSSFAAPKSVLIGVGGYPLGVKWNEDVTIWGIIALKFPVAYSPEICSITHRFMVNDTSSITEYQESPFPKYVSIIPKDELLKRDDAKDLIEYCDYCRLAAISRNIYSGHGRRARLELSSVKSPHYTSKKYQLYILSYFPQCGMRFIRNHVKVLSYLKRKIIRK